MERAISAFDDQRFSHSRFLERQGHARTILRACHCLALGLFALSCSTHPPISEIETPGQGEASPINYAVVCIIHGDGGYLYHDPDGNDYRADEVALSGALKVAQENSQAEVFIFHQKRRRRILFLFPRHDGEFYYYRYGRLLAHESYWREGRGARFDPEIAIYHRFRAREGARPLRLFLYFGHESPEMGGRGYDASHRNRAFTVHDLADGLKHLRPDSSRFDLAVLSTCFNGTPYTISALTPHARYILASPGNLHLSYFDLRPFERLDVGLRDGNISAFAKECARTSFERLSEDIQTEITVAVYDVDRAQEYVQSIDSVYDHALSTLQTENVRFMDHCDCAEDSVYVRPAMSEGVDVLFRAARFGRAANKQSHSGWECPRRPAP